VEANETDKERVSPGRGMDRGIQITVTTTSLKKEKNGDFMDLSTPDQGYQDRDPTQDRFHLFKIEIVR
ncbi:hypothetical protein Tco_1186673, partial [Tanacetum coccineum]